MAEQIDKTQTKNTVDTKKNRNQSNNKPNNQVIVQHGNSPFTKYYSERRIKISNPQVAKQLKHVDYFGLNYSVLMGAFIKASQSRSVGLFDEYVDKLIATTQASVAVGIAMIGMLSHSTVWSAGTPASTGSTMSLTVTIC